MALLSAMSCTISPKRSLSMTSRNFNSSALLTFMGNGAMKNKWSAGWAKAWFYCKVPLHVCPRGAKTVHALRSHMSALDLLTKPSVEDSIQDLSDDAFVRACKSIFHFSKILEEPRRI
jgi:hypothetical protein